MLNSSFRGVDRQNLLPLDRAKIAVSKSILHQQVFSHFARGGRDTHILYSSRSTDTCVKKGLVKVEVLILLLYSSKSTKVQSLKYTKRFKVNSTPLKDLCKTKWSLCNSTIIQRLLHLKVESVGFVWAICEHTRKIADFWDSSRMSNSHILAHRSIPSSKKWENDWTAESADTATTTRLLSKGTNAHFAF